MTDHFSALSRFTQIYLKPVKGIKFTPKEIDVIACLLGGRSPKTIAPFLSVNPRTVETHLRNIMNKIGGNSRHEIRDFIEKSEQFSGIRVHYLHLLTHVSFETCLNEISGLVGKTKPSCLILTPNKKGEKAELSQRLARDLTRAGIKIVLRKSFDTNVTAEEKSQTDYAISIAVKIDQNEMKTELCLYDHSKNLTSISQSSPTRIELRTNESLYYTIFAVLKIILPTLNIEQVIAKFKKHDEEIQTTPQSGLLEETQQPTLNDPSLPKLSTLARTRLKKLGLFGTACIIFISSLFFILKGTTSYKDRAIQPDLVIPPKAFLLQRATLLDQIKNQFKNSNEIQTVVLVGLGGAGKTTLARQYANLYGGKVNWEINAEKHESLVSSFENLTEALAATAEEKSELKELQHTQDQRKRDYKLLLLVKKLLFKNSGWLLIYDNVDSFPDISKFFPHDVKIWGEGKIIITTRDGNIGNNIHIPPDKIIHVGALTPAEQNELFRNILMLGLKDDLETKQTDQVNDLLQGIPPFPLDISIAAKYIKNTKIPIDRYLTFLKTHDNLQESSLKIISGHEKTRLGIVKVSLDTVLKESPIFKDLLLLVSLVNSQDIPRDLIVHFKEEALADQFLFHLKKHSLVLDKPTTQKTTVPCFSIHRSTQEAIVTYLLSSLKLEKDQKNIQSVVSFLCKYMSHLTENDDIAHIKYMTAHVETLLKHSDLLDAAMTAEVANHLAYMYVYLGSYERAKLLYSQSIAFYQQFYGDNHIKTALSKRGLGIASRSYGEYETSKDLLEAAYAVVERQYGPNHPETITTILHLGNAYRAVRNYKKSKDLLERGLIFFQKNNEGLNKGKIAWTLVHLGKTYKRLRHYSQSLECLEKASRIYKELYGDNNIYSAFPLGTLGSVHGKLGYYDKALLYLSRAQKIYKEYYGNQHIELAIIMVDLGTVFQKLGYYSKALEFFKAGYEIYKNHFGTDHIEACWSIIHLGNIYRLTGELLKAKELIEIGSRKYIEKYGTNHPSTCWALLNLAHVYNDLGHYDQAKNLYQEVLDCYQECFGKEHFEVAQVMRALGEAYLNEGNLEKAEDFLINALEISKKTQNPETCFILETIAGLNLRKAAEAFKHNKTNEVNQFRNNALQYLNDALKTAGISFSQDSAHVQRLMNKLNFLQNQKDFTRGS